MICLTLGRTWPDNLISPSPSARPLPGAPIQPRKKPTVCHSASRPRQPGITGSPLKWQGKNQRSGFTLRTARIRPLPYSPPASAISVMRSNISIGGSGNCGPSRKSSLRPQASRSSYSKLERRFSISILSPRRSGLTNTGVRQGKALVAAGRCNCAAFPAQHCVPCRGAAFCERLASEGGVAYDPFERYALLALSSEPGAGNLDSWLPYGRLYSQTHDWMPQIPPCGRGQH